MFGSFRQIFLDLLNLVVALPQSDPGVQFLARGLLQRHALAIQGLSGSQKLCRRIQCVSADQFQIFTQTQRILHGRGAHRALGDVIRGNVP